MECVKTGCHAYSPEYGEYLWCDAFETCIDGGPGSLVFFYTFRVARRSFEPITNKLHFTIHTIDNWFDKDSDRYSTLIATSATNHGYEGKEI